MLQLSDFQKSCSNALSAALAHEVYRDLWKDDNPTNLAPHYDDELKVFFLNAEDETKAKKVYLPVLFTKDIDFTLIQKLQKKLSNSSIFLAIVDNNGNILYYQIHQEFEAEPAKSKPKTKLEPA